MLKKKEKVYIQLKLFRLSAGYNVGHTHIDSRADHDLEVIIDASL